jgi:tetratricopeptide (TPR) repeat protein
VVQVPTFLAPPPEPPVTQRQQPDHAAGEKTAAARAAAENAEREKAQRARAERERAEHERVERERVERERQQALEAAQQEVERLIAAGNFDEAGRVLAAARASHRQADTLRALERRLQDERRRARDRAVDDLVALAERSSAAARFEEALKALRQAAQLDPQSRKLKQLLQRTEAAFRRYREEQDAARAPAAPAAHPSPSAQPASPAVPAGVAAPRVRPAAAALGALEAGSRRTFAVGAAVAAAVVIAAALWALLRTPASPGQAQLTVAPATVPSPATSPLMAPAAPASGAGLLVIDAAPWGEITEVLDATGKRLPIAGAYTPAALSLAPGEYTIALRNPAFPRLVSLKARVQAARVQTQRAEFQRVDASEYFNRTGW